MSLLDAYQQIKFIYQSYVRAQPHIAPNLLDVHKRHPQYCRRLLEKLGLSLSTPPSVLVTGSKGKGSTSVFLARMMQTAGFRTGLFTGPHLVDFCERIRVNGEKIPEPELIRLIEFVRPYVEGLTGAMPADHYMGPVGTVLAVALLWYREQGTDFHVLECGRGALADDVNVMANRWSVLTPIMLEHPENLGPTLLDIAANKMAVIKSGLQLCVSYRQTREVTNLLKSLCRRFGVPLKLADEDFTVEVLETGLAGSTFRYKSRRRDSVFRAPLPGSFQSYNAGVALALAEEILPDGGDEIFQAGLSTVRWPGRCELLPGTPTIILDGAINAQSAEYLRELLQYIGKPLHIIIGVPRDKDWQGVIETLAPLASSVLLTQASNKHLIFPRADEVVTEAQKFNPHSQGVENMRSALARAVESAGEDGAVVIVGTQSLIRDAKIEIQEQLGRAWE